MQFALLTTSHGPYHVCMIRRISKTGLGLCTLYFSLTALCVCGALSSEGDPKGRFVLLQLPLTAALMLFDWLGLDSVLHGLPWVASYALMVPLTLLFLYGVGWLVSRLIEACRRQSK